MFIYSVSKYILLYKLCGAEISGQKVGLSENYNWGIETNGKIQNITDLFRRINDFKERQKPRSNIVKNEKGDLVADSHSIVARCRNYFSQLFEVTGG